LVDGSIQAAHGDDRSLYKVLEALHVITVLNRAATVAEKDLPKFSKNKGGVFLPPPCLNLLRRFFPFYRLAELSTMKMWVPAELPTSDGDESHVRAYPSPVDNSVVIV